MSIIKNQKKIGIIISYINIVLNMIVSVFFTPFLISSLGQAEYGVYRTVQSFAGQLAIMTFGISAIVTRNIAYYDVKKEQKRKENFLAMALIISVILSLFVFFIGMILCSFTDKLFGKSFTAQEIITAKKLFILLVVNVSLIVFNDFFSGIPKGHEKFAVVNGVSTVKLILRILTMVILLKLGFKSVAIVLVDVMLSVAILLFNAFYDFVIIKERIKYHYFDKELFLSSLSFSLAIFLQAIVNQVNQNMDNMILGVMTESKIVAVYSVAVVIYTTYNSVTSVFASVFTPKATQMLAKGCSDEELTDLVSSVGRYQFMIIGLVLTGFIIFGKEFINLWLGHTYEPVYKICLILLIPVTVPLIQSTCNAVLDAKMKRMGRSVILIVMAVINFVSSVIFVKKFGYIGAAYGTSLSTIVGHIILINIYYYKSIHLNVIKMFKDIFHKILIALIALSFVGIPIGKLTITSNHWVSFILKCFIYTLIYAVVIGVFALNKNERKSIKSIIKSLNKKFTFKRRTI